jgi:hypothetical protein
MNREKTKAGKASTVIAWIGWFLFVVAVIMVFWGSQRSADMGYFGPSLQDLLFPLARFIASLAGLVWLIAALIGFNNYTAVSKTKRERNHKPFPLSLILGSIGLVALIVFFVVLRMLGS